MNHYECLIEGPLRSFVADVDGLLRVEMVADWMKVSQTVQSGRARLTAEATNLLVHGHVEAENPVAAMDLFANEAGAAFDAAWEDAEVRPEWVQKDWQTHLRGGALQS